MEEFNSNNNLKISLLSREEKKINNSFKIKSILYIIFVLIIMLRNNVLDLVETPFSKCYNDLLFNITSDINLYLSTNQILNELVIFFSSFAVDFLIIITLYFFVFKWDDWILIISFCFFYSFRFMNIFIFQMSYPESYIFKTPGFPSITVSYLTTNDFFYSGHVGLPTMCYIEFKRRGYDSLKFLSLFIVILQFVFMIFVRGHYAIDLIFGIIFALYFYDLSCKYVKLFLKNLGKTNNNLISDFNNIH